MENEGANLMQGAAGKPGPAAGLGGAGSGRGQVYKERVCFNPHPKTLTMAGDYEYFAAQGHHPLAFALAELVDNALRATKGNRRVDRPRSIVVSLVMDEAASRGLVVVRDNGVGMTPQELNNWAVMNLSMEDRGLLDPAALAAQPAGGRYLSGDIRRAAACVGGSGAGAWRGFYFGVGSKNAAFYLGRTVKVVTRPPSDDAVHELCIRGAELERRFKAGEAVYEEDMLHRPPGAAAPPAGGGGAGGGELADVEEGFAPGAAWLAEEVACADAAAPTGAPAPAGGGGASFTRVVVGDLKPDVLAALAEDGGLSVLRDLAHLYHYYIHGPKGNAFITPAAREQQRCEHNLPGGEALPDIVVELLTDGCAAPCVCGGGGGAAAAASGDSGAASQGVVWRRRLADVDDDMESRYLRAARSTLEFSLDVPAMGAVEGVLWYFPFEDDKETVPMDDATNSRMALTAAAGGSNAPSQMPPGGGAGAGAGANGGRVPPLALNATQLPALLGGPTQAPGGGPPGGVTQRGGGGGAKLGGAELEMQDAATSRLLQACPVFEAFWQGRLIPGACVPSLPFLDTVRLKRTAAAKDLLPDEAFGRVRGALFFGPGWRVTRNKLMFRDNLPQLLADAVPSDRHLERRAREWLVECHRSLDRSVRFEGMVNQATQAQARRELGEDVTLFERIHDGLAGVAKGDVVRLATKPQIVGKVLWFLVPRVVHTEGCYSHGKVTVSPVPAEMFGEGSRHTWPIRRIERAVTKAEVEEHVGREMLKLPASLRLEPLKLSGPGPLTLAAGANLPESTAEVLSGAGQRMSRALIAGHKHALRVVQTLYYLGPGTWGADGDGAAADPALASPGAGAGSGGGAAAGAAAGAAPAEPGEGEAAAGEGGAKGKGGKRGRKRKQQEGPAEGAAAEEPAAAGAGCGQEEAAASAAKGRGKGGRATRRGVAAVAAEEGAAGAQAQAEEPPAPEEAAAADGGGKRQRGARRTRGAPAAAEAPAAERAAEAAGGDKGAASGGGAGSGGGSGSGGGGSQGLPPLAPGAEVVLRVENRTPSHDQFAFHKLKGGLMRAGRYVLEYSLLPELPGGRTLGRRKRLQVSAGPAASFDLQGDGRAAAQARPLLLGEALLPLRVAFRDAVGNAADRLPAPTDVKLEVLNGPLLAGGAVVPDLQAVADIQVDKEGGSLVIGSLRIIGTPAAAPCGLSVFQRPAGGAPGGGAEARGSQGQAGGQRGGAAQVAAAEVFLAVHATDMVSQGFPLRVRPGAPHALELLPGHPFASGGATGGGAGGGEGGGKPDASDEEVVMSTPLEEGQPPAPKAAAAPGGCGGGGGALPLAVVTSGDTLPEFRVRALDAWGNPTAPTPELPFSVALACSGLDPTQGLFSVDDRRGASRGGVGGVALVTGLAAVRTDAPPLGATQPPTQPPPAGVGGGDTAPQVHAATLWPQVADLPPPAAVEPPTEPRTAAAGGGGGGASEEEALALALVAQGRYGAGLAAAVAAPARALRLKLGVLPSTMPAKLMFGEVLQMVEEAGEGDDGEPSIVWVLAGRPGLEAGGTAQGLALRCLDEAGRPSRPIKGRLQVSWAKGSSKRALGGDDAALPPLPLPEAAGEPVAAWVRFNGDAKDCPGMCLEVFLRVVAAPGPAASWSMSLVEYGKGAGGGEGGKGGKGEERDLSVVACGRPFYLEALALDRFGNKCDLPLDERPEVRISAEHETPSAPMQLEHKRKWSQTQEGTDVCVSKLWLAGPVGRVSLSVRDDKGEDGASRLTPDELAVTLTPGPPAALAFDGPAQLTCGTRGVLGDLRLRVLDNWANLADTAAFEVALNGCALAAVEGAPAAKAAAAGSNRSKVKGGAALFKAVRLTAEAPGAYVLRAASATRKVAVADATVAVQVAQQNFVAGLDVAGRGLPPPGCEVGGGHTLQVDVHTEDGAPLPWDAAAAGLVLRLEPPKGPDGSGGGAREAVVLLPDEDATRAATAAAADAAAAAGGDEAAAAAAAGGARAVCFVAPPLAGAGRYRALAEFTETRPELLQALPKADRLVRSPTVEFTLAPGPPAGATLEGPSAGAASATVSNGADAAHRRILAQAAVQLVDGHGNAAPLAGVRVRWRLAAAGDGGGGGVPPDLECDGGAAEQKTDERGRAFFGDVLVAAGTGRVEPGAVAGLECELALQAKLGGGGWSEAWRCAVLVTDDAARAKALRALQSERDGLQQRLSALKDRLQEASRRVEGSRKEARAAARTAERCARQLQLEGVPPGARDAAAALEARRAEAAVAADQTPALPAMYGPPASGMTQAIQRCLVSKDPDMVGVFAQLVTVEDRRLAEVASAAYMAAMQVVVVQTYECITRMRQMLAAGGGGAPLPSMLSYTLIQPFRRAGARAGEHVRGHPEAEGRAASRVRMRGAGELARRLAAEACEGTDEALPLVLPHTRVLVAMQERGHQPPRGTDLVCDEWPPGCLGFVVNLLRPAVAGHRKTVMYAQLGRSLVFETMEQAAKYRQTVTQVLRTNLSDIFTLDGQKISGRGVVVGSSFRVTPLADALFRFGSRGGGGGGQGAGLSPQQDEVWQALVAALEAKEAAEAAAEEEEARQQGEGGAGEGGDGDEAALRQRLAEVGERIKTAQQQQGGGGGGGGGRGGKRGGAGVGGGAEDAEAGGAEEGEDGGRRGGGKGAAAGKRRRMDRQQA
ncbi:MAG: hypothetical protein J3K34DRAFT_524164 [Monoraphidium minutum]|nr:MAG: hypothetical protein J3K34DRAFT_524164 [Monoraphidium minutum]